VSNQDLLVYFLIFEDIVFGKTGGLYDALQVAVEIKT